MCRLVMNCGDAFMIDDEDDAKEHLHIILTKPTTGGEVITVPICTRHRWSEILVNAFQQCSSGNHLFKSRLFPIFPSFPPPDYKLTETMNFPACIKRTASVAALAALLLVCSLSAQQPSPTALPLPEDRGVAALAQSLRRLQTTARVMVIVAHPDDEDGPLLTYLSRGLGARAVLLTLTRGEGGQNAMGGESYDALGLIRTNELLRADEYYGVKQLFGTEADFGFSKTQEESFARWGHDRVLYDAVLAVRRERPQIILSTFVGGVSDGHGHHQVSGEIAQEAFKAAADPSIFPDQLKDGLQPWQPLAAYSMVPFASITDGKILDYATGKWTPARFKNYVTSESSEGALSADVALPVGQFDPVLGRSYVQIAREGWGQQKSQYGGASPALSGPATTSYHLWAVAPAAAALPEESTINGANPQGNDLFRNPKVHIETTLAGLAAQSQTNPPAWLLKDLQKLDFSLQRFEAERGGQTGVALAHALAPLYRQTLALRARVAAADLPAAAKSTLLLNLDAKLDDFQSALANLLGLDLIAFTTQAVSLPAGNTSRGASADETPRAVAPGEKFRVRARITQAAAEARLASVEIRTSGENGWSIEALPSSTQANSLVSDRLFNVQAAPDAAPTQPYFSRASIEQPFYDLDRPALRLSPFAPYPLEAWAEFTFDDLPIRIGQIVQTLQRSPGAGGFYEPLVVTPAIGLCIDPAARILPLDGRPLPVRVRVHAQSAAEGTVALTLPAGWRSDPAEAPFRLTAPGDSDPLLFSVTPAAAVSGEVTLQAVAHAAGRSYQSGWKSVGYPGLRPYNLFESAQLKTRKVDVKLAPGLRVAYVMGTGDQVPEAIQGLGVTPHLLTPAELVSDEFSTWNTIVIGIRAYSTRPELVTVQPKLATFVRNGGTLIVLYQSASFPAPIPLNFGHSQNVVDEQAPVQLLRPADPLLSTPNLISAADFDDWVEERGHSFLESWDPAFTPLTQTADPGQDPQRGGFLVAHPGKGTYVYLAFALHRQLPELVPGAYRILANLLSAAPTK